tara:strand:- start:339 stop:650 length:312 start_codon:yes stop_codon:yes gene_type:complete
MRTIYLTVITASAIIFYSSVTSSSDYNAKISISIPELINSDVKQNILNEINPISGIQRHSINLDTRTLEIIVDLHIFSIDELIRSFDLMGISSADPKVEDIYY